MSRAFVREDDTAAVPTLPERPISPHPNFVTPAGEHLIDQRLNELQRARLLARERGETEALAGLERELRYWRTRRASARVIAPTAQPQTVRFGVMVALRFDDGAQRRFQLVGEDEADPAQGLVSWTSPVGNALIGRVPGDAVTVLGQKAVIESLHA